jgi:hypothetical protein
MAVEHGEDRAARAAEEGFGEDGGCTHFGVMCTRNGYGGQGVRGGTSIPRSPKARDRGHPATARKSPPRGGLFQLSYVRGRRRWPTSPTASSFKIDPGL